MKATAQKAGTRPNSRAQPPASSAAGSLEMPGAERASQSGSRGLATGAPPSGSGRGAAIRGSGDIARIFMHGRSQAVRIPKAFRLPGEKVRVRRLGQALLLEPLDFDLNAWYAELDRLRGGEPFLSEGRPMQPPLPEPGPGQTFD